MGQYHLCILKTNKWKPCFINICIYIHVSLSNRDMAWKMHYWAISLLCEHYRVFSHKYRCYRPISQRGLLNLFIYLFVCLAVLSIKLSIWGILGKHLPLRYPQSPQYDLLIAIKRQSKKWDIWDYCWHNMAYCFTLSSFSIN
jgi:hypothetical protein